MSLPELTIKPVQEWIIEAPDGRTELRDPVTLEPLQAMPLYVYEDYKQGLAWLSKHGGRLRVAAELMPVLHEEDDLGPELAFESRMLQADVYASNLPIVRVNTPNDDSISPYRRRISRALAPQYTPAFCYDQDPRGTTRTTSMIEHLKLSIRELARDAGEKSATDRQASTRLSRFAVAQTVVSMSRNSLRVAALIGNGMHNVCANDPSLASKESIGLYTHMDPESALGLVTLKRYGAQMDNALNTHFPKKMPVFAQTEIFVDCIGKSCIEADDWQRLKELAI